MINGPSLPIEDQRLTLSESLNLCFNCGAIEPPNLTTFAQWIELQPIAVHVGLLDLIGNDLYRRHWPTIAGEIKAVVRDLWAMDRKGE